LLAATARADVTDGAIDAARAGDFGTALAILVPTAQYGDAHAEFVLGLLYEGGLGVAKDTTKAADLYRRSAQQGLSTAENNLASLYANGDGVTKDVVEAMRWWRLAAEQGLSTAQLNLAEYYAQGLAVPQDYVQAYKWASLAAAQGEEDAGPILAILHNAMSGDQMDQAQRLIQDWHPLATSGV
jgi:TPR repeat protein